MHSSNVFRAAPFLVIAFFALFQTSCAHQDAVGTQVQNDQLTSNLARTRQMQAVANSTPVFTHDSTTGLSALERISPHTKFNGHMVKVSPTVTGFEGPVTFETNGFRVTGEVSALYYDANGVPRFFVNHDRGDWLKSTPLSGVAKSRVTVRQ